MPQHGYGGTLYRVAEDCLTINSHNEQQVIKISHTFSLNISGAYIMFIKGDVYLQDTAEPNSEEARVHIYSENPIVKPAATNAMFLIKQVKRKVILYPHQVPDEYILIMNSQRFLFLPQYPEPGDMVTVSGESGNIWLAHVQSVNPSAQTCQVYFYIADKSDNKLYTKEHNRLDKIHWDSILGLKAGMWRADD